jgi:hypothetical protein
MAPTHPTRQEQEKGVAKPQSMQPGTSPQGKNPPRRPEQNATQVTPSQIPGDDQDDGGEGLLSGQPRETEGERDVDE